MADTDDKFDFENESYLGGFVARRANNEYIAHIKSQYLRSRDPGLSQCTVDGC